ncbi:MAG: pilus assembly PilX family protein, partial [Pseudoalteromonas prydzensis]
MINKQHGFTLITVLILTSMASIVVLNSLRENIVQERMSGNFQKKMNSRLLAEKGVFEEAKLLQQALLNDQTLDIDGLIAATGNATGTGLIGSDATYNASISKNAAGELEIASIGERYEGDAQSSLVARFGFTPGNSLTPYSDAIIGCRGVSLGGSGKITSYDSTDPTYVGNDADVRTTVHNADVTLNGTGTIKGSVASTGSIIVSSSQSVEGDLWANKDITFPSGTSTWSTKINGNILANGNVQLKDMMVNGYVRTEKNLTLNNGVHVNHSTVDIPDILYGG